MAQVKVLKMDGSEAGTIELKDEIFGIEPNEHAVLAVVKNHLANKRQGTQGNIKRHGHRRGPMTHGSKHKRLAGALAAGTYPSRVFKGNHAPGRMGRDTVTVQNVVLVKKLDDRNIMMIKGAVPGKKGGLLKIRPAVKGQDK